MIRVALVDHPSMPVRVKLRRRDAKRLVDGVVSRQALTKRIDQSGNAVWTVHLLDVGDDAPAGGIGKRSLGWLKWKACVERGDIEEVAALTRLPHHRGVMARTACLIMRG